MNSPPVTHSVLIREEGKLSSSSDDEEAVACCSIERLIEVSNPDGGAAPDKGTPVDTEGEKTVKLLSPSSIVNAIDSQTQSPVQSYVRKSVEKGPASASPSTTKWNGKLGTNDNLVIVFSDDESGSDNEVKQKKVMEVKGATSNIENRRPAPSSLLKVGISQKAIGNKAKFQPKRRVFSQTFIASNTRTNGPKLTYASRPIVNPGFSTKNNFALSKKVENQLFMPKQGTCLDIGELQDLRQKIALRETELKLKSSRINRETISGSSVRHDSSNININNQKRERARDMPSEYVHPKITEPDMKRIRNDSSGQMKQTAIVELLHRVDEPAVMSFRNTSGPDNNPSGGQSSNSSQQKNQLVLNQHTESVCGFSNCQKELDSSEKKSGLSCNINSFGPGNHSSRSVFAMEEIHDKELEEAQGLRRHCEIEERNALKAYHRAQSALIKAIDRCNSLYQQRELSSAHFLSLLIGEANVHEYSRPSTTMDQVDKSMKVNANGDRSLQLLLKLEDSEEKELEEAQDTRHKCEIDERRYLKEYRRTQLALIEASEQCRYLYLQRQQSVALANVEFYSRCYDQFENSATVYPNSQSIVDLDVIQSSRYVRQVHTDANPVGYGSNFYVNSSVPTTVSNQYVDGNNTGSETCSEPASSASEPLPHPDCNSDHLLCSSYSDPAISVDLDDQTLLSHDRPCPPESGCEKQNLSSETRNGPNYDDASRTYPADCDQDSLLQEAKLRSELRARLGGRPMSQKIRSDVMQRSVEVAAMNDIEGKRSELQTSKLPFSQEDKTQFSSHGVDRDQDWDAQLSIGSAACSPGSVLRSTFAIIRNMNLSSCEPVTLQAKNLEYLSLNMSNFIGSDNCSEKTHFSTTEDDQILAVNEIFSKQYESYSCNLDADLFWPLCMYELRGKCNDEECCWQHINPRSNKTKNRCGSHSTVCSTNLQFPISIASSRLLQRKILTAELSGNGGNRCFQANESNRKLSYLQRQDTLTQLENRMPDVESYLEMALIILDQEIDKFEGTNKALALLSRAIEVDPKSSAIWIIYTLVYYSSRRSNEKDDMCFYAVENNAQSYELWLLYINSRVELGDRLVAYDKALSALCSGSSVSNSDSSSLILDIFLQMLDFLCVSGQVEKAMAKVQELIHSSSTSDESHRILSRLYSLLTLSDKCILLVCCLYLGVYRKLPESVAHHFELEKELLEIDWPNVELKDDGMRHTKQIMIAVEQIVDSCIDTVSLGDVTSSKLQFFAVNYFRCKVALEGVNSGKEVSEKYIQLFPSCWELVLLMARMYNNDFQELTVSGFEEALFNWPKEVPGIHCIWNQYAAYSLENQRLDVVNELVRRWYESAWRCQFGDGHMSKDEEYVDQNQHPPNSMADKMFGWLTLALYHKLRNEYQEAQLAADRALEIAPPDMYKHCVREHAAFHLLNVQPKEDASISNIADLLNRYLVDPRASCALSLSRKFISNIKKPRAQQLVNKFLAEISPDCAILNSALEAWYGPSLLPRNCTETKQLVNFVEAVMEIMPTNHRFASNVFRQVSKHFGTKDIHTSSLLFWAGNLLVNSIFQDVPVAPESVWVEASVLLGTSTTIREISEKFHERAVSVYPFSIRLWKSHLNLSKIKASSESIIRLARERGIHLKLPQQHVD